MSLSSLQLDAFQAVIAERNFSKAAKQLKITQGALSQRIQNQPVVQTVRNAKTHLAGVKSRLKILLSLSTRSEVRTRETWNELRQRR